LHISTSHTSISPPPLGTVAKTYNKASAPSGGWGEIFDFLF